MNLAALQSEFADALMDPEAPVPTDVKAPGDVPERRFAVYRNNVAVSLVDALAERYPVCQRLVGEEFFRAMARLYVAGSPPVSPLLMTYGEDFHAFISDFKPAREISYLGDVAFLEAARTRAYHAPDAEPVAADEFGAIAPAQLVNCRLDLHPSVEILRSPWAAGTIWRENIKDGKPDPVDPGIPEDVLVARPGMEVTLDILSPDGEAAFMIGLADGMTLGEAAARGGAASIAFDAQAALSGLIQRNVGIAIHPPEGNPE